MQVTAAGNVYSYSFALLEILTTRLPVDEAFGEGIDMVKWVRSAPLRDETPKAETRCKGLAQFLYLEKRNAYSLQSIFTMHKKYTSKKTQNEESCRNASRDETELENICSGPFWGMERGF